MKKGDLFPIASPYSVIGHLKDHRVQYTGEKRYPQKGEWYISGAIPEGYLAPSNLTLGPPMHIGKLVKVKVITITKIEVIEDN